MVEEQSVGPSETFSCHVCSMWVLRTEAGVGIRDVRMSSSGVGYLQLKSRDWWSRRKTPWVVGLWSSLRVTVKKKKKRKKT